MPACISSKEHTASRLCGAQNNFMVARCVAELTDTMKDRSLLDMGPASLCILADEALRAFTSVRDHLYILCM